MVTALSPKRKRGVVGRSPGIGEMVDQGLVWVSGAPTLFRYLFFYVVRAGYTCDRAARTLDS